jgi:hypothetical protein
MAARRPLLLSALVVGVLTLGCGASVAQSQTAAQPGAGGAAASRSSTTSTGAEVTASASASAESSGSAGAAAVTTRARVDTAASAVVVDVTITGPAELLGGCQPTLTVRLVDSAGKAFGQPSPAPGSVHCLAIVDVPLAAGQTRDFTASVPLPAAHGTYTVEGQLNGAGPIPTVTVAI